jgi:pyrroline-5-carboxylate reductase
MQQIAFIGGGNMASALVAGLVGRAQMHVVDLNAQALVRLAQQYGVSTASQIDAQVAAYSVVLLAVKPQNMREVALQLAPFLGPQHLVISIAAGIRVQDLSRWLGGHGAIVRCMPNTPALIGRGMTGMFALTGVSDGQRTMAEAIMNAVGITIWVEQEHLIDAVTAVSGSGPAYVFYFMEAMQQAGQDLGLSASQALLLAQQTFVGATQLALDASEPLAVLRERVTSKGGTTYAALTSMGSSGVGPAIVSAVKAAAARGHELGVELGQDPDPAQGMIA